MNTTENNIKIFVPKYFSDKVKYICGKIPSVEWCGIVFYTVEGSIKDITTCKYILEDILPMSKDSGGATSYTSDSRVVDYLMKDDKRLDWKQGDIHSHHNLGSFFSSTDYNDLRKQTDTSNVILSITVDNKNLYVGKVATKAKADTTEIKYMARDENGKYYPLAHQNQSLEIITIFNCVFEFEDESLIVDDEFASNVDRIIKEAEKKTTQFPAYQHSFGQGVGSHNQYKDSDYYFKTPEYSSISEEDTLTMEEDIFITALLGRSPKFTDTLYLSIKDFVLDKMPLKAKLAYFSKNLTEALTSYTEVLSEKIELCEGVVEVIKENKMSFPYVMEELIKEMSNYIEVLKNGRKF